MRPPVRFRLKPAPVQPKPDAEGNVELVVDNRQPAYLGVQFPGLVAALGKTHRAGNIRVVAHELTDTTRDALRAGTLDVVLDQNPDGEVRAAIAAARQVALSPDAEIHSDPIEIGIFLRDNLR